jgi:hypothetical protein
LQISLDKYRKWFLKRKNINGYKKLPKGTPQKIDRLINCFDRKIENKQIFNADVKKEYFEGISIIYNKFYELSFDNRLSWKEKEIQRKAEHYILYGNHNYN